MELFYKFIEDVTKVNTWRYGNNVKLAVQRHLDNIESSKSDSYPYYFDEKKAKDKINILKKLRHTKGSFGGKLFDVQPHQAFTFGSVFGWVKKDNTSIRRFQKMYKATAKKSGKSEEMAALEIIFAFFNQEVGAEVFTIATKKDQAHHVFTAVRRMCKKLIEDSPIMKARIKLRQYDVIDLKSDSIIGRLTDDDDSEDGSSNSCTVVDEYHAHKKASAMKGAEMAGLEREDSMTAIITTAGFNKEYPCFKFQKKVCEPVLRGDLINEELFVLIFDLDVGDDPHDERNWYKSNPNLGNTPKLDKFRTIYRNAKMEGATEWSSFMTKCLNQWMDTPSVWIQSELWNKCANTSIKLEDYKGFDIILGLDLSTKRDISALYVLIPPQKNLEKFIAVPFFFCPEAKIRGVDNIDDVDYRQFQKDNEIIITTGKKGINYDFIENQIKEINSHFEIITAAYDPYNADNLIDNLEDYGIDCMKYEQTTKWMHPPTKKLELFIIDEEIEHTGNKCMNWMMGNVVLLKDTNGNTKINKDKSIDKVDGPVALSIAIGGYLTTYADGGTTTMADLGVLSDEKQQDSTENDDEVMQLQRF